MGGITIKISGAPETIARLKGYPRQVIDQASRAGVYAVANKLIAKAMPITPKRKGPLRASMEATLPIVKDGRASCEVGAGGAAAPYAAAQHQGFINRGGQRIVFRNYTEPGTGPLFLDKAAEAIQSDATAAFMRAFDAVLQRGGGGGIGQGSAPASPSGGGGGEGPSGHGRKRRGGKRRGK